MSVLEAVFAPDHCNPKTAFTGPCVSVTFYSFSIRLKGPVFTHNAKKGALRLVQSALNHFIVSRILQKSRRKNAHFGGRIDPFQPLLGVFQAFCGTWSLRRIIALTGTVSVSSFPVFFRPLLPRLPWPLGPLPEFHRQDHVAGVAWSAFLLPIPYWLLPVSKVWEVCIPYGRGMEKV